VGANGQAALNSLLASCGPGIAVTNIDNGFGAACIALRALNLLQT
jgi:NCAIR mutase (PurE)-related protein